MMKQLKIFLAGVALSCFALFPAAAMADIDELDVTMEVLDSIADIDGQVIVMQGPEDDGLDGHDNDGDSDDDFGGEDADDDFAHDEDFESDEDEEHSEDESDFDEGDDIDHDEPDEEMDDQEDHDVADSDLDGDIDD